MSILNDGYIDSALESAVLKESLREYIGGVNDVINQEVYGDDINLRRDAKINYKEIGIAAFRAHHNLCSHGNVCNFPDLYSEDSIDILSIHQLTNTKISAPNIEIRGSGVSEINRCNISGKSLYILGDLPKFVNCQIKLQTITFWNEKIFTLLTNKIGCFIQKYADKRGSATSLISLAELHHMDIFSASIDLSSYIDVKPILCILNLKEDQFTTLHFRDYHFDLNITRMVSGGYGIKFTKLQKITI